MSGYLLLAAQGGVAVWQPMEGWQKWTKYCAIAYLGFCLVQGQMVPPSNFSKAIESSFKSQIKW